MAIGSIGQPDFLTWILITPLESCSPDVLLEKMLNGNHQHAPDFHAIFRHLPGAMETNLAVQAAHLAVSLIVVN